MPYEYAVYFKLLLLCGFPEELQQYVEQALLEQDPLSEIILSLSLTGSDPGLRLSVLHAYLLQASDADLDDSVVFDLVLSFLQKKYRDSAWPLKSIAGLMYRLAVNTERYDDEPWSTMYCLGSLFEEAEAGFLDQAEYLQKLEAFLCHKTPFCSAPALPKESRCQRLLRKIRGT